MAEWLRRGLQILARRFDSGSGLQHFPASRFRRDDRPITCDSLASDLVFQVHRRFDRLAELLASIRVDGFHRALSGDRIGLVELELLAGERT